MKIDVAVNAPEAGTITQWFVNAEDNVEVGQKLCEIDTEGKASGGGGGQKAAEGTSQNLLFFVYPSILMLCYRGETRFRTEGTGSRGNETTSPKTSKRTSSK